MIVTKPPLRRLTPTARGELARSVPQGRGSVRTSESRFAPWTILARLTLLPFLLLATPLQAVDYGGFFEFTLYSQDDQVAEDYKPDVILLFHGFGSAMPNGTYGVFHEAFMESHTVLGFNYDYTNVPADIEQLDELYRKFLKGRRLTVVGTSLGGFWANYFANAVGAERVVLINPVIDPQDTMRRHLGKQYSKKRQMSFTVTEAHVSAYGRITPKDNPETRKLVLLTKDDEVLDHQAARQVFAKISRTEVVVLETGGHSMPLDEAQTLATIRRFIEDRQED